MNNSEIKSLMDKSIEIVKSSKTIYLCSHVQPDGDNIGSLLALGMAIKKLNKDVNIIKVDEIPKDFLFLPNIDMIKEQNTLGTIDLFISLDNGDIERLGIGKELALRAKKIINIDHHITNDNFGDINIVVPSAAATGEIIYRFINEMGVEIDKDIATCIYVAISTDTGSFMYDSTTSITHLIAADLINKGIDLNEIIVNIYQSRSLSRTKLHITALNTLELLCEGKVAVVSVSRKMLEECNSNMEDAEGIVSYIRDIEGVEIACILKEVEDEEIKISLRSKSKINVAEICSKYNGGGHKRAAGCTINKNIYDAKETILKEIYNYIR